VLNAGSDVLVKTGYLVDLELAGRVITPGAAGLNELKDLDTVVYLAAVNADRDLFASFKAAYGSYQDLAYYQRRLASNNMYQAVMRSGLRTLRFGDTTELCIVVFGQYEATLMKRLLSGRGGQDISVEPASTKMMTMFR